MADEKTLFNKNEDNEDKKHPIAKETDADFVDFSAAFDGEDDEEESFAEFDEEFESSRSMFPLRRGLSFLKRKKEVNEDFSSDEDDEEEKEEIEPVKEKKKNKKDKKNKKEEPSVVQEEKPEPEEIVDFEASVSDAEEEIEPEEKVEEKKLPKKKGFSLFGKKEKKTEAPVEEETEEKEIVEEIETVEAVETVEEQPVQQDAVVDEPEFSEEEDDSSDELIIILDDSEDDEDSDELDFTEEPQEEKPEIVEKQEEFEEIPSFEETVAETEDEPEEVIELAEAVKTDEEQKQGRISTRFAFLNKRRRVIPVPKANVEETAKEMEIELLPSFEEAEVVSQESVQEEKIEPVAEKIEIKETEEIEELPPFEVQEEIEEIPPFEAQEEIEELPPFEAQEEIEEIPPFEAQEEIEELPPFEEQEEIEELPPFEEQEEIEELPSFEEQEKLNEAVVENEASVVDEAEETSTVEPMTMKDHLTFILIIVALLLAIVFITLKFIPLGNNEQQNTETAVTTGENVSEIEISRKSIAGHLIQSDIENVFYAYSQDYSLKFYQSNNNGMKEIKPDGSVNAIADVNNEKISVKVDYVKIEGELFGTGLFRKRDSQGNYLHDMVVFKLVNLPEGYVGEGKALLLATSNSEAISQSCNVWENSFIVDLETGATTKFISDNGNMYLSYSILTNEGYAATNGKIPFFTTRDYDATTNKKDIYLKSGNKETSLAKDVAGSYVYVNGDTVCYLKNTENGFKVVRNGNGKETLIFSLDKNSSYLYHNEYLLDKYNGVLYNVQTGKKINVTGYGMSNPEMMTVSDDGRYLVVLGNVNSAIDYQVHIFDLEKNECAKYVDDNFSNHKNLAFAGNSTIVYSAVEPNQGCEYVMIDVVKAFK